MIRSIIIPYVSTIYHFYWKFVYHTAQVYWFVSYSIAISSILYLTFYQYYLPASHHVKPLHFQYSSHCERGIGEPLCSFPEVSTLLHDSFEQASDGTRVLTRGQKYNMHLELVVPLTRNNKHVGMFMSKLDVIAKDNLVITSASRSSMLSTQDSFVATLSTFVKLLPLLLGIMKEKEVLVIPLIENYVDDSYVPAVRVNITVLSKHLEFYSANLRIFAVFTGMRYYMHNYPLLFSIVGFPIVMFFVSLFALLRLGNRNRQEAARVPEPGVAEVDSIADTGDESDERHEEIAAGDGEGADEIGHVDDESDLWERWEQTQDAS